MKQEKKKVRKGNNVCYQEWKRSLMKIGGRMLSYDVLVYPMSINDAKVMEWMQMKMGVGYGTQPTVS